MRFTCLRCGRNKFQRPSAHWCRGGATAPAFGPRQYRKGGVWVAVSKCLRQGSIALVLLLTLVGCSSDSYERDHAFCRQHSPDNVSACLRSRGWHDAHGLRNSE
jgi:hypothetical protein